MAVVGLIGLVGTPAVAATPGGAPAAAAGKPSGCMIAPDRVADVGSQVTGLVERLAVERGERVSAGQTLATLRADVERANVGVAATRARIDADVLAAQASMVLARQKAGRAQQLQAENFVSDQAVEQARGELDLAIQKLAQSRSQQRVWAEERRVADAQLALRTVRSPFDGVVVERFVNLGERVEEKPLLRVAAINPLRVELMVPTAQYGAIKVGDQVTVRPELPGVEAMTATVRDVDRVLDAASNSFRVRLSLPNPGNRLPAGLRCKADLPGVALSSPAPALGASAANASAVTSRPGAPMQRSVRAAL